MQPDIIYSVFSSISLAKSKKTALTILTAFIAGAGTIASYSSGLQSRLSDCCPFNRT